MDNIWILSIIVLGGMGLLLGAGLAFASKKFAVEVNPLVEQVREFLPGANCGACGFAGCDAFAAGSVEGKITADGCPVCSAETVASIAGLLGQTAQKGQAQVAYVACRGGNDVAKEKYNYEGVIDCKAATLTGGGPKSCQFGCLGFGTCVRACPFDAIHIDENGLAVVDTKKCTGCKKCVATCPKEIISMVPAKQDVFIACLSKDKGKIVKEKCSVGCIGCGICAKACEYNAIVIENNLAIIDYDKCVNCMVCVGKCPTKSIQALSNKIAK